MFFVLPGTPTLHPTPLAPRSYKSQNQGYYQLHPNVPRFAVPPYPTSQQRFFHQPSAEQLEEREYHRAIAVISNYHRRQAEREATARRHRQAEAAHQRDLVFAIELEQRRRREELVTSHRAEIIRTRQARTRLAAAERRIAVDEFLGRLRGGQPVTHRPQVVNRKSFFRVLEQHHTSESDPDVTEQIRNVLTSLGSRPVRSEKPENPNDDSAELVEDLLSSLFPGFTFQAQPKAGDNEAAPALHAEGFTRKPGSADVASTSGPLDPSPTQESMPPVKPTATETDQVPDRTTSLSSIERIRNNLTKLQADFALPTELDHYAPCADDHDDTASVLSISSSDFTKLIPYTSTNKPVYKYEQEMNGLLEGLDRIESHGDTEVRDKRKEVVKAVERALEGVEHVVGEVVKKRLSLVVPTTPATEELLKGFDVDEEEVVLVSAEDKDDAPVVVDDVAAPEESTHTHLEAVVAVSMKEYSPPEESIPESGTPVVPDNVAATPHDESSQPDIGPSTSTSASESVELSFTITELAEPRVAASDTLLLAEEVPPRSPVKQAQLIESDIEDGVLVLDDDWSEIEN